MRCEKVQEQLPAYLDDALGWFWRRQVGAHLRECVACRRESRALRQTMALTRGVGPQQAPRDVTKMVMARIAAMPPARARRRGRDRRLILVPATAAAAAVLCVQVFVRGPSVDTALVNQPNPTYIQEHAQFRADQEIGGGAGMIILASELTSGSR